MRRWLALLLLLAGCAAPREDFDFETCGVRPRLVIPIEMRGPLPLMQATIKGQPATFVLDTGAVAVALTQPALRRLGLGIDPRAVNTVTGVGGTSQTVAGRLEGFRIGDLEVPDHRVLLLPPGSALSAGGIDGLFGVSVLSVFEVELDLPRRRATLYAGRLCPDTLAPPWAANALVMDASRSERGRFVVPVVLDGKVLNALVDTGAGSSFVTRDAAAGIGVTPEMLARDPQLAVSGAGPANASMAAHRFGAVVIAGERFEGPVFHVGERVERGIDMILGADYLAGRRVWLSYARRRVFVEKRQP